MTVPIRKLPRNIRNLFLTENNKLAVTGCKVQWPYALILNLILERTNFHQMTANIKMVILSCNEQWRCTTIDY